MLDFLFNGGEVIGFVAAFLTTIAFIPQVLKVLKTKSVEGLSLSTYLLYILGVFLWFIHGVNLESLSMIIGNFVSIILTLIILRLGRKAVKKPLTSWLIMVIYHAIIFKNMNWAFRGLGQIIL